MITTTTITTLFATRASRFVVSIDGGGGGGTKTAGDTETLFLLGGFLHNCQLLSSLMSSLS